jgi:hypothetical protein
VPTGGALFEVGVRPNVMLSSWSWFASMSCLRIETGFPLPKRSKISEHASAADARRAVVVVNKRRLVAAILQTVQMC